MAENYYQRRARQIRDKWAESSGHTVLQDAIADALKSERRAALGDCLSAAEGADDLAEVAKEIELMMADEADHG